MRVKREMRDRIMSLSRPNHRPQNNTTARPERRAACLAVHETMVREDRTAMLPHYPP